MINNSTITIAIMKYGNFNALEKQLDNLKKIYHGLPEDLKSNFNILISDNCSNDGSRLVLEQYAGKNPWASFVIQTSTLSYDEHVLFLYNASQGDYVWFCAIDDFIKSWRGLFEIFKIIHSEDVAGIIVGISSDRSIDQNITIERHLDENERLIKIINSGKVSKHIIKKHYFQSSKLENFVGSGYMHLSIQTLVQNLNHNLPLIDISTNLVYSEQRFGDKNLYHPKFACEVINAMQIDSVMKSAPSFFVNRKSAVIIKGQFLIRNVIGATTECWHADFLLDFIHQLYLFKSLKNNKLFENAWLLLTLLFLIRHPNFFRVAINAMRGGNRKSLKSDYDL